MSITIDSTTYDVDVTSVEETCDFLDKYAERTQDGTLHRELIGTYHNQTLVFAMPNTPADRAEWASLWEKLTEATEFHTVTVPDEDGIDFTFTAYFSQVKRSLVKWNSGETRWRGMQVKFTAQNPRRTP